MRSPGPPPTHGPPLHPFTTRPLQIVSPPPPGAASGEDRGQGGGGGRGAGGQAASEPAAKRPRHEPGPVQDAVRGGAPLRALCDLATASPQQWAPVLATLLSEPLCVSHLKDQT